MTFECVLKLGSELGIWWGCEFQCGYGIGCWRGYGCGCRGGPGVIVADIDVLWMWVFD